MASLVKRPNAWYVVFNDHTGRQRWVKGYSDKRETQALAAQLEDEKTKIKRGDIDPKLQQRKTERAKPIDAHIEDYEAALEAKGNSENHIAYTTADIRKFVEHSKVTHAEAIARAMVDQWVLSLTSAKIDSRRTINRRVGSLQAFLKHLHSIGTLTEYVLMKYPKLKTQGHEKRKRRPLDASEQSKLLASTTIPTERSDLYKFVLMSGARHSACVALTVDHVDFGKKNITLKSKDNQHRNRVHVVPMHDDLVPILKRLTADAKRGTPVFTVPPTRTAAKLLRSDCTAAGIDTTDIDFHALRHSFITRLARADVHPKVLQALAGHADVETTLSYYTHFKRSDERAAVDALTF